MTQTVDYEIVGSYNNQRVSSIDAERSVNVFEYIDPLGKKKKSLISTSGLTNQNTSFGVATGGYRAQFVFNNNEYDVIGNTVFRVSPTNVVSILGTIGSASGYVGVAANTFQIIFVDGQHGYVWDTTANTFTQITDTSFPAQPIDCDYMDGFFIVANGQTNTFQLSMFNQGLVWGPAANNFTTNHVVNNQLTIGSSTIGGAAGTANFQTGVPVTLSNSGGSLPTPLDNTTTYYTIFIDSTHIELATSYANAISGTAITITGDGSGTQTITSLGQLQLGSITSDTGTIVACRVLHRRLFLYSQFFTEVWENAGAGSNLPFRRNNSLLMEYGTPSIGSIDTSFDIMIFQSQSRKGLGPVMMISGVQPIPISTMALDNQLNQYAVAGQISDCSGFMVRESNIIFYRMNFTAANHTFVYNVTQSNPSSDAGKLWHEEEVLDGDRHPAQTSCYLNGINYVGNYKSATRYVLDPNNFTNDGEAIRRMRITKAFVPPGYQRIRVDRLQVDFLQGNLADLNETHGDLDLFTELGFILQTESGNDILLEQQSDIETPQNLFVFLSISKDGGQTYGYNVKAPMGHVGQRTFRTLWRKLGTIPRGQAFVAKFEFYQAVPFIILGASWAMEVLPE